MKNLSVKLLESETGHGTINRVVDAFSEMLETGPCYSIEFHPQLHQDDIKDALKKYFSDDIEIQDSVYDGCYGSSSGKVLKGFKVYIEATRFPDRFIDSDFDEIVNIEVLCNEYGKRVDLDNLDADAFKESMYLAGIEGKSENTYNYLSHSSDTPCTLADADFTYYEFDEKVILSIKFHCGGDPRGNYTSNVLYEFDYIDDLYCAIFPNLELIDEENIDEINRLKDLISKDPKDKNLLIKELKELIG